MLLHLKLRGELLRVRRVLDLHLRALDVLRLARLDSTDDLLLWICWHALWLPLRSLSRLVILRTIDQAVEFVATLVVVRLSVQVDVLRVGVAILSGPIALQVDSLCNELAIVVGRDLVVSVLGGVVRVHLNLAHHVVDRHQL